MTERERFIAAIAARPRDDTTRLVFADWLDEHGEPTRADYIRAACQAAKTRPGTHRRAELLDRVGELLARHEADWLGEWRDRLIGWKFRRGFVQQVQLTANQFLRHGDELFRAEPVGRVVLVDDASRPLDEDAIRAVVNHPAFAFVRDCAVIPHLYFDTTPVYAWLTALAENPHVTRLRRFAPIGYFRHGYRGAVPGDGIDEPSLTAFCNAPHLRSLRTLNLDVSWHNERVPRP